MQNFLADDAAFAAFAAKVEDDNKKNKSSSAPATFQNDYEEEKWLGLKPNQTNIVRIVGNNPENRKTPYDAKCIYFFKAKDDSGKNVQIKLPLHASDIKDEHIMWKIINKVKEVKWIPDPSKPGKNMKDPIHKNEAWYEKVTKAGFSSTDPKDDFNYKTTKGWGGQEVVIMNIIDREDDWCATNKHTKLLSKKVGESVGANGQTIYWPEKGVPSYGFLGKLRTLTGQYGSWEKYDVAITKTNEMQNPYYVKNATAMTKPEVLAAGLKEVPDEKVKFVSQNNTLTTEELSWERYDLDKLYAPSSYQKLLKCFGNTIKDIDASLNTTYYDELKALADNEKAQWEATKAEDESVSVEPTETPVSETPASTGFKISAEKIALLKGWKDLTDVERSQITDVLLKADGTIDRVVYSEDADALVECNPDGCGYECPSSFKTCPICGVKYA